MKRLTYREDNRARLTQRGNQVYCCSQATADIIAKYEELLIELGYEFDPEDGAMCIDAHDLK